MGIALAAFAAAVISVGVHGQTQAPTGIHHRRRSGSVRTRGRRLGHRGDQGPADELHQDRRHQRPGPIPASRAAERELQRLGARIRPRRFQAAGAQAEHDAGDAARRLRRRRHRRPRRCIPATTGCRCSSRRLRACSPARVRRATASVPAMQSQSHWINSLKSDCNFCHQLGNQLTRSRRSRVQGEAGAEDARRSVGMEAGHRRPWQLDVRRPHQSGPEQRVEGVLGLDRARRQGRGPRDDTVASERESSATSCSRCGTSATTTRSCTTCRRPTRIDRR